MPVGAGWADLAEVMGEHAGVGRLESAGVQAMAGSPMQPDSAIVSRGLGGSVNGFEAVGSSTTWPSTQI